ncbi:MAG: hypothetical protein M3O23_00090, partial [Actinomycetota bacterium]|nr:hypothetical protein [Actinomycetota bacterium]
SPSSRERALRGRRGRGRRGLVPRPRLLRRLFGQGELRSVSELGCGGHGDGAAERPVGALVPRAVRLSAARAAERPTALEALTSAPAWSATG